MSEVINPVQVENAIRSLANSISRGVIAVSNAETKAREARREYDIAFAHAYMDWKGAAHEKKYAAVIATEAELEAADVAELAYKHAGAHRPSVDGGAPGVAERGRQRASDVRNAWGCHVTARILAFGSREVTDLKHPEARMTIHYGLKLIKEQPFFSDAELHHGDCDGADRMFAEEWEALGGKTVAHPAKWNLCSPRCNPKHRRFRGDGSSWCPSAGFRRNKEMVDLAPQLGVKAHLNGSKGTAMTANLCEAAGIHVVDIFDLDLPVEPYRQED